MAYQTFDWRRSYGTLRHASSEMKKPTAVLSYISPSGSVAVEQMPFDLRGMRKHARQSLRRTSSVSKAIGSIHRLAITVYDSESEAVPNGPVATLFPATHSKSGKAATKSRKRTRRQSRGKRA